MGVAIGAIVAWGGAALGGSAIAVAVSSAITYAVIGAAIGGLSAAVMGGDIGKGMLWGAVGGAVAGGISGYIGATASVGSSTVTSGQTGMAAGVAGPAAPVGSTVAGGTTVVPGSATAAGNVGVQSGGVLSSMSPEAMQMAGTTLAGVAEGVLSKPEELDYAEQTAAQKEIDKQKLEAQAAESALQRGATTEDLKLQLANVSSRTEKELAEQRRQFDVSVTSAAARQRDAAAARKALTVGEGTTTEAPYDPAMKNVLDNKLYENVAGD